MVSTGSFLFLGARSRSYSTTNLVAARIDSGPHVEVGHADYFGLDKIPFPPLQFIPYLHAPSTPIPLSIPHSFMFRCCMYVMTDSNGNKAANSIQRKKKQIVKVRWYYLISLKHFYT